MKVLSSNIQLTSSSRYFQAKDETVYTLDEQGQVADKTRMNTVEKREKLSSARYRTQGDYFVDIQHDTMSRGGVTKSNSMNIGGDLDDDLDKNLYMASVFEWAADAIDEVVSVFEAREKESASARILSPGADVSEVVLVEAKDIKATSMDLSMSIYKEVAMGYRLEAQALRPIEMQKKDNGIRRVEIHEKEDTIVQAGGMVKTAEGQTIDFSLTVGMHQEKRDTKIETYRLVDPLIINFSGDSAQLQSEKIDFDLDGDGVSEQVARLGEGSGFLALDLNNDGKVNSGIELFGPSTGNGFQELSLYDKNKNGWIDENDEIYDKLMIWIQDDSEQGVMEKLSNIGIGAIHLGAVASDFLLEDSDGKAAGRVVSTGVSLTEDGSVKTVQQVNLLV